MSRKSESELRPRNGKNLMVIIVARISGCQNQKELSLDDQVDHGKEVTEEYWDGPVNYRIVATKGKGERLDRPELIEIEELIRTAKYDLIVFEDVGRLVRGPAAHRLCGIAVDHGTRVISPNDAVDTAEETWEEDILEACKEHMKHNAHTSRRIKHKLMNRFKKLGAATPCPIAGYIKPQGAKTFSEWSKDQKWEEVIVSGKATLKSTFNGAVVADYFNDKGFPPGPYARNPKWDGPMVLRFFRNPLLKGMPARGNKHSVKHNESGRRVAIKNPKGPVYREEPHLAFFTPAEFDELCALLAVKNKDRGRPERYGIDPRAYVPTKRTRAFGQHARCWYCGRHYVWGGNGISDNLMCTGARNWNCWNSIGFNGPHAAERIVEEIMGRLDLIEGMGEQYRELIHAAHAGELSLKDRWSKLQRDEETLTRHQKNFQEGLREFGASEHVRQLHDDLQHREAVLKAEREFLENASQRSLVLPATTRELRDLLLGELKCLAMNSFDLGDLIRQLVPQFYVYLVRLCDGGHLLARAKVKLNLLGSFADGDTVPGLRDLLSEEFTLDLFVPPEREQIREQSVLLQKTQGLEQRQIAAALPGKKPTQTAVFNALSLQRRMDSVGLSTPYLFVEAPPADYTKLRRHLNPRYEFKPLEGYVRPQLP